MLLDPSNIFFFRALLSIISCTHRCTHRYTRYYVDSYIFTVGFTDRGCNQIYCCMCESTVQPTLTLRGLCPQSNLDEKYVPFNPQNGGKLVYIGLFGTKIEYNRESFAWIAKRQRDLQTMTTAIIKVSESSLLLGSHEWIVQNDTMECSVNEAYSKILTLSGCGKNQFRNKKNQNILTDNLFNFYFPFSILNFQKWS